jgi:hypothetical protein
MASRVSIFKKIAFDEFIPQYSGDYPTKIESNDKLHSDWVEDFKRQYQTKLRDSHVHGAYTPRRSGTNSSYVMHGNGQLDELPRHHERYIREIANDIIPDYNVDNDKYFRYKQHKNLMHAYELIHHLFNGGIRVYVDDKILVITTYQIPNNNQLKMLNEIFNKLHIEEIRSEFVSELAVDDK